MAFDAFLKLDGIKGESEDIKHPNEIDVISFSWRANQTGTSATGGGGGAGKVAIHDLHFVHKVDRATPLLFLSCATGAHISQGTLVVRKAGGEALEYLKIKLTDVMVSSVHPHGQAEQNELHVVNTGGPFGVSVAEGINNTPGAIHSYGDEIPYEAVTLNFAKVEILYQPQGTNGAAQGGPVMAGWDVKANKKC